jgi:hypothetical protein
MGGSNWCEISVSVWMVYGGPKARPRVRTQPCRSLDSRGSIRAPGAASGMPAPDDRSKVCVLAHLRFMTRRASQDAPTLHADNGVRTCIDYRGSR